MLMALLTPLTLALRESLLALKNARDTYPRTRERIEMVLLADAGWSDDRIAQHLGRSQSMVQGQLRRFEKQGTSALEMRFSPGRTPRITAEYKQKLLEKIASERTYTSRQLCDELESETGIRITPDHLREVAHGVGGSYKRTKKTVKHNQKPEVYEPRREALSALKKSSARRQA
jgi:transposase